MNDITCPTCGMKCWKHGNPDDPCAGKIHVEYEEIDGSDESVHYCDNHNPDIIGGDPFQGMRSNANPEQLREAGDILNQHVKWHIPDRGDN